MVIRERTRADERSEKPRPRRGFLTAGFADDLHSGLCSCTVGSDRRAGRTRHYSTAFGGGGTHGTWWPRSRGGITRSVGLHLRLSRRQVTVDAAHYPCA